MSRLYVCSILPQNYIAEEILIGSIIINPNLLTEIISKIEVNYFFIETHKILYRSLLTIYPKNHIDPVQLTYCLQEIKILNQIGGIKKITQLIKQGQVFNYSKNFNFYIQQIIIVIQNNYNRRLIIQYGYNIVKLAYNKGFPNSTLILKASQYLNYINSHINTKNLDNLQELIGTFISNIQQENNTNIFGNIALYSGFRDLDILTNGLPDGDLIVIAGRPSMGKTSFVMNVVYNLIKYFNTKICLFSLEMTKTQILHKLISIGSRISTQTIRSNKIDTKQWYSIQEICNELLLSEIYINDNPNISIDEIQYITQIVTEDSNNNTIIIIDYLQLISEKNFNIETRNQELSYITRKLKILAQTLKIPIIVLSQLNRSIEKRLNKQPLLSDLKESGCISSTVFIKNDKENKIHIKTINKIIHKIKTSYFSAKKKLPLTNNKNIIKKIYILKQYIFTSIVKHTKNILITDNHKILNYQNWICNNQMEENYTLMKLNIYNINCYKIEKMYKQIIKFYNYHIVYDISKYKYCNFICNTIILHNSIEQDADIVMMLYKHTNDDNKENNLYRNNSNQLDIIISKNRNGPVGSCQLEFNPINNIFQSIDNDRAYN